VAREVADGRFALPAATSEQARKSRCPSREREGFFGDAALGLLGVMAWVAGWRPTEFWAATPADVAAVLAGRVDEDGEAPLGRSGLAAMMEAFPDG